MTNAAPPSPAQAKVLKVALVVDEKIAQERVIDRGTPVTIGTAGTASFVAEGAGVDSFELFGWRDGHYVLRFVGSMKGKVTAGGEEYVLKKAAKAGNLPKDGDAFVLALVDDDKGKLEIGNVTVLFRFVEAPAAPAPVPVDNFDFRPRLFDRDDPAFGGFLMLFSALGVVFSIWVTNAERPKVDMSMFQKEFERVAKIQKIPQPEKAPEAETEEKADEAKKDETKPEEKKPDEPEQKPLDKPKPRSVEERAQAVAEAREQLRDRSALFRSALALQNNVLGTTGEGKGSVLAPGSEALQGIAGSLKQAVDTEGAAGALGIRSGGVGVPGGTDKGIGSLEAGKVDAAAKLAEVPKPTLKAVTSVGDISADGASATDVRKVVAANKARLTYCYESRLKANPKLAGSVKVAWEVAGGKASDVEVVSNTTGDDSLGTCIRDQIRKWSFTGIEDGSVTQSFVFTAQEQ